LSDISVKQALTMPSLLMAAMVLLAAVIGAFTGVDGSRVFLPYLIGWAGATLVAVLVWIFVQVAILYPTRAEDPLRIVLGRLGKPVQLAALPAFIFPLFLGGYTWAKCSIPFVVGYGWEGVWANGDRMILGMDAWRWAHIVMPDFMAPIWSFYYAMIWGFALAFSGTLISAFATRRFAATFFTAMMLSWLIGGVIMAYLMSAAGPVFAHLADPDLDNQFAPLRAELARLLASDDLVMMTQRYLAAGMNVKIALKGGGISAMPSMHIATATIFVLAARGSKWIWPALLFFALTFFGSVYLGYHYAIDAPVAAAVATLCWSAARRLNRGWTAETERVTAVDGPPSLAPQPAP